MTPNTIPDEEVLFQNLERIRDRGFALDDEERLEGLRCVASAIDTPEGRAVRGRQRQWAGEPSYRRDVPGITLEEGARRFSGIEYLFSLSIRRSGIGGYRKSSRESPFKGIRTRLDSNWCFYVAV